MNRATKNLSIALGLLAALASATPARAEGPAYGVQLSYALPTGTTFELGEENFDSFLSAGLSAALTAEWGLGPKTAIRLRGEYTSFGAKDSEIAHSNVGYTELAKLNYDMKMFVLGADYLYGFDSNEASGYAFGGVGYYVTNGGGSLRRTYSPYEDVFAMDGSGNSLGISFGVGCRFTKHVSCELRFTTVTDLSHDDNISYYEDGTTDTKKGTFGVDINWIQASFCYRF